ncbi:MAG: methyl-accepting chemotaxis protein [Selenomonadaceae bacterium]|nr:methyl-accepting chemotaxis protein [Selenomonadaceae bacterium]
MGFRDISIRKKFIILTGVVTVFMLLISFVGYITASRELNESLNIEVNTTMKHAAADMDGWMAKRISIAQSQAALYSHFNGDFTRIKAKDTMSLSTYDKEVIDMGVGLEDGTFTSYIHGLTSLDPRQRPWYLSVKDTGKDYFVTSPYEDLNTHQILVSIVTPVRNGTTFVGAVCEDIGLDILGEKANGIKYRGVGYATFMDAEGVIIATNDPALKGVENISGIIDTPEHLNTILSNDSGNIICTVGGDDYVFGYAKLPSVGWIVGLAIPYNEVFGILNQIKIMFAVITLVCLVVITLFCTKISNAITEPVLKLEEHAKQMANGNLRMQEIPIEGTDEIGVLTSEFNIMCKNLRGLITKMLTTSEQLAASSDELMASSTQSANTSVTIAETVSEVGGEITKQMQDIDAVKKSIDVVSGDIQIVSDKALNVADTSERTAKAALTGEDLMQVAIEKMRSIEKSVTASAEVVERLGESSKQIGQIVEAIAEISDQTNLLALNAAIEAARAGEHGRGFTVVSEEVRKLATASQESAEKIRARIESIQASTEEAVQSMKSGTADVAEGTNAIREVGVQFEEIMRMVDGIKKEITGINQSVKTVSDGTEKIVAATNSIDKASQVTNGRTQSISSATETQSASNEEIAAAAQALSNLAADMQDAIGRFKV